MTNNTKHSLDIAYFGDNLKRIRTERKLSREEFANNMMENPADFYYGVLWNKLYKKNLIQEHRLFMDKDISWCEDFMFNLEYIRHIQSIYVLKIPIYYYVKKLAYH